MFLWRSGHTAASLYSPRKGKASGGTTWPEPTKTSTMPNKGKVFYRVLGSNEFGGADYDDARAVLPAGYCASGCDTTMFTFKNIQNPMNSGSFSKRNCIGLI